RRACEPPAADTARGRARASDHQDRLWRGLCDRCSGRDRMNGLVVPLRLLPSTMFGRLAGSLLLVVGVTLAVVVALVLRDRGELSIRVGGVGDTSHRIEWLTHRLEELHGDASTAGRTRPVGAPTLQKAP